MFRILPCGTMVTLGMAWPSPFLYHNILYFSLPFPYNQKSMDISRLDPSTKRACFLLVAVLIEQNNLLPSSKPSIANSIESWTPSIHSCGILLLVTPMLETVLSLFNLEFQASTCPNFFAEFRKRKNLTAWSLLPSMHESEVSLLQFVLEMYLSWHKTEKTVSGYDV